MRQNIRCLCVVFFYLHVFGIIPRAMRISLFLIDASISNIYSGFEEEHFVSTASGALVVGGVRDIYIYI